MDRLKPQNCLENVVRGFPQFIKAWFNFPHLVYNHVAWYFCFWLGKMRNYYDTTCTTPTKKTPITLLDIKQKYNILTDIKSFHCHNLLANEYYICEYKKQQENSPRSRSWRSFYCSKTFILAMLWETSTIQVYFFFQVTFLCCIIIINPHVLFSFAE